MSLLFKVSDSELAKARNDIFLRRGMPALLQNGFIQSPYSVARFGWDSSLGGYAYDLCRVSEGSVLDMLTIYICKGERWIQEHINVFRLHPTLDDIKLLKGLDGLQFYLPPNSRTRLRLAPTNPLIFLRRPRHKLGSFFSKQGYERSKAKLGDMVEKDLMNIDEFINRWKQEHVPMDTDWEGVVLRMGKSMGSD